MSAKELRIQDPVLGGMLVFCSCSSCPTGPTSRDREGAGLAKHVLPRPDIPARFRSRLAGFATHRLTCDKTPVPSPSPTPSSLIVKEHSFGPPSADSRQAERTICALPLLPGVSAFARANPSLKISKSAELSAGPGDKNFQKNPKM